MNTDQIFCCYAPADRVAAEELAFVLTSKGFNVSYKQELLPGFDYEDNWKREMQRSSHVLFVLSESSVQDEMLLEQVRYARSKDITVLLIRVEKCELPPKLLYLSEYSFESIFTNNLDFLVAKLKTSHQDLSRSIDLHDVDFDLIPRQSSPPMAMPAPEHKPTKKGFFKTIFETLNPFSSKSKNESRSHAPIGMSANKGNYERSDTTSNTTSIDEGIIGEDPDGYSYLLSEEEASPVEAQHAEKADDDDYEKYDGPILMAGPPEPEEYVGAEPEYSPLPPPPPQVEAPGNSFEKHEEMNPIANPGLSKPVDSIPTTKPEKSFNNDFFTKDNRKGFGFVLDDNSGLGSPTEFIHVSAPIDKPQPLPKGKLLYDIPDAMTVNVPQRCLVRIGASEAIVRDDDTFSPAVKVEAVPISKVMEVDMADIEEPANFNIKKISTNEQLVEDDSYTEWVFMVTPLTRGKHPLILKVSVIKLIDGKERRKELVFEKSVTISAAPQQNPTAILTFINNPGTEITDTARVPLKDLSGVALIKELDPPSVFISYAHLDKTYFDIFNQYLQTHSGWKIWTDRNIEIGSDWFQSIQSSIKESDIAVLLISAGFISSGFIKEHEFHQFSTLQQAKPGFKFLPLLLRDADFTRWQDLAAMQLFVAYGDEYGVPEKRGVLIPFAKLCRFDNNSQLIPNDNIDTYFKNLVKKAEKDWLMAKS